MELAPIGKPQYVVRIYIVREWFNVVSKQKLNKQNRIHVRVRSHIVCNVRTQMHADRNSASPMHAYMKHAMCEHRSMQTGTVQGANTYAYRGRV